MHTTGVLEARDHGLVIWESLGSAPGLTSEKALVTEGGTTLKPHPAPGQELPRPQEQQAPRGEEMPAEMRPPFPGHSRGCPQHGFLTGQTSG